MGSPMPSPEALRRVSAALTVHNQTPDQPPSDQGIWIRIPTGVLRAQEPDDPYVAGPAVDGTSALAVAQGDAAGMAEPAAVFRLSGEMRDIGFAGKVVSVREMQGFRIIAELFARPHTRISAVEMRAAIAGVEPSLFAGSSGQVVTPGGLAELRHQYESLNEDLEEAELANDEGRARKLQEELVVLADHVRRAVGKDGTPRKVSDAERARVAVSKALTRARKVLAKQHPALLKHITRTIHIGHVLCYQPEAPIKWGMRS